ncbi:MAG: hypothetical protein ACK4NC_02610 [Candidatus Gracilibacteria bacterium]
MADSVKKNTSSSANSTIRYLPFSEIHDDTLILKDGSLRGVVEVGSVNFSLKSEEEQNAIIYSYQNFLNSLEFPVQILIKSKKLDLDDYLDKLRVVAEQQTNPLLKKQTIDYIQFIGKLIEYADIMEKKFYIVIPYDTLTGGQKKNMFQLFLSSINPDDSISKYKSRKKEFVDYKKGLLQRMSIIQSALESCGLTTKILTTKDLIQLFYGIYNPLTAMDQKLKEINILEPQAAK